ncbi:DUF4272 domain-containing protein [Idiomarina sp. M1R2S28]|uniref:DUF4272 domain-containing protein n=1 Tax=Idiomarina rhizosphaerae TaxID=2961572 RepID=A0A9X2JRC8_9GAMM|nr:DUF4272 domain-containing protein [Idiomarina rhizosphaerae]MCP1339252.1 DUF4272 domain-containing protein [Idiomarina rhizosphaerae]
MSNLEFSLHKIKSENTAALRRAGIEVIDHLPALDDSENRTEDVVAKRWIAMGALLQLHFKAPETFIKEYLDENDLLEALSPKEKEILDSGYESLNDQQKTDLYWTIEAIWAFAWAGQKHDSFSLSTGVEDSLASMLPNFAEKEAAHSFIASYHLRSKKELFSNLDMLYRAHWFARQRNLEGEKSALVDLDIVMERRKALEWICDAEKEWDNISLDT